MAQLVITAARESLALAAQAGIEALISSAFAPDLDRPRLEAIPVQTSRDGAPMPRLYGRSRIAGQVIWAARPLEHAESGGGKGGPSRTTHRYTLSFAVGLCEGEAAGIGRIWADGEALDQSELVIRFHPGAADQAPDALIEAIEGPEAPGFRDTAYVVFEDLPLDAFGHRLPNLSFEVFRAAPAQGGPRLEEDLRSMTLIPGSGEFAYAPAPVRRDLGPGREQAENVHNRRGQADLIAALDDLQASFPHLAHVQLVLAWFGDDLRCGACTIRPGVENRDKITRPRPWSVAGLDRSSASLVTQIEGRPAYGGAPDDQSVLDAIAELKARGLKVTLYPFILMDIAPDNALPDPHGGAAQPAFPWRGRITCHPAPGQPGSPDGSAAAEAQISAFFGQARASDYAVSGDQISYSGPQDWGLNRFILHCAALGLASGGLDGFLIGSELVALTTVRGAPAAGRPTYPAVAALMQLAQEARALLGPATRISYAADWSEYSGHRPGDGSHDVIFHLDPLWAHPEIDAIAIDYYLPLSDWRDGTDHLDAEAWAEAWPGGHDRDYLASGVEGGEYGDWYYASGEDRAAQIRTPILDGAHGENWVFAVKRVRDFWSNAHHDRPGGARDASPTPWIPMSKPVWFTELGCPAVDKGANQPNVFFDPKSAESALPHFSSGARDDLIQRRALEAVLSYWNAPENNPLSPLYGGRMIETGLISAWAWDARPFPDFPARTEIWSDGENWRLGHWLNGRAGLAPLGAVVGDLCRAAGLEADVSELDGVLAGYLIDRPMSARQAIAPLADLFGFALAETANGAVFRRGTTPLRAALTQGEIEESGATLTRPAAQAAPRALSLAFLNDAAEYQPGHVRAQLAPQDGGRQGAAALRLIAPITADPVLAAGWAETRLDAEQAGGDRLSLTLNPSRLALEPGDGFTLDGGPVWRIDSREGDRVEARRARSCADLRRLGDPGTGGDPLAPDPQPALTVLDLPLLGEARDRNGPLIAVSAAPWPGPMRIEAGPSPELMRVFGEAVHSAVCGHALTALPAGPRDRWDEAGQVEIALDHGRLASLARRAVLEGGNLAALRGADGVWRLIQFARADLIGPDRYRLGGLLHGRFGSPTDGAPAGADFVLLDHRLTALNLPAEARDAEYLLRAGGAETGFVYGGADLSPLPPAHFRARRGPAGIALSWIRQGRIGAEDWTRAEIALGEAREAYRLRLFHDGAPAAQFETEAPGFLLEPDQEIAIFGGVQTRLDAEIAQISQRCGPGAALRRLLEL